ncbi:glycerophosphodiester phosphodiesterase family protein [Streptomyces sp. HSW2009]|uniref:glycerophosphodiester phosphodiesterase family protein n=1 Tax=Streptomyces sp. HSW2009 TaxID=3142890 RepID=UPI0032EA904B
MRIRSIAAASGLLLGASAFILPAASAQAADHPHSPVTVAHRGASAYAPENTLAAVDAAAKLKIDWVENDVQRTKDGKLIVIHDTTLNRTTNVEEVFPGRAPWKVSDFTLKEIQRLDAGSWFNPKFTGERVPTLKQYMDRVSRNHQKLLLEFKAPELYPNIERETLNELRHQGWLNRQHVKHRLIIQSFNADSVKTTHELRPDVKTGFLGTPAVADLPKFAKFADQINPHFGSVDPEYVAAVKAVRGAHGKPLEVYTWTVDDAAVAVKVAKAGVTGIITNKPDVIRDAVSHKGKPGKPGKPGKNTSAQQVGAAA